jgi:hypothetical protein
MFYDLNESAKLLKISRRTLNRKLKQNNFPVRYFDGGKPLIYAYDLVAYVLYGYYYEDCDSEQQAIIHNSKLGFDDE